MDNMIFNVKGESKEDLLVAMEMIIKDRKIVEYWLHPDHGIVLHNWTTTCSHPTTKLLVPATPSEFVDIVWRWIHEEGSQFCRLDDETNDDDDQYDDMYMFDMDVDNQLGWRVYIGKWNKVDNQSGSMCAIKPSWCWYGK